MDKQKSKFTSSDFSSSKFISHTRIMSQIYSKSKLNTRVFGRDLKKTTKLKDSNLRNSSTKEKFIHRYSESVNWKASSLEEKSRSLSNKLKFELSSKTQNKTDFQIFSDIFYELCEFLFQFKDLLVDLRQGMIESALKECESPKFEFWKETQQQIQSLNKTVEKELKEKQKLVAKLNKITDELEKLRKDYQEMQVDYLKYKKVVESDTQKYIDANSLIEKMLNQCSIIVNQQNYIQVLKSQILAKPSEL